MWRIPFERYSSSINQINSFIFYFHWKYISLMHSFIQCTQINQIHIHSNFEFQDLGFLGGFFDEWFSTVSALLILTQMFSSNHQKIKVWTSSSNLEKKNRNVNVHLSINPSLKLPNAEKSQTATIYIRVVNSKCLIFETQMKDVSDLQSGKSSK